MHPADTIDTIMKSMVFFMSKIHNLESRHDKLFAEFKEVASQPLIYPFEVKNKVFKKIEKVHDELVALHQKQKVDLKNNAKTIENLGANIESQLREAVLDKITQCIDSFDSCMRSKENAMKFARELNELNL